MGGGGSWTDYKLGPLATFLTLVRSVLLISKYRLQAIEDQIFEIDKKIILEKTRQSFSNIKHNFGNCIRNRKPQK